MLITVLGDLPGVRLMQLLKWLPALGRYLSRCYLRTHDTLAICGRATHQRLLLLAEVTGNQVNGRIE
jgi:hypothetical protein